MKDLTVMPSRRDLLRWSVFGAAALGAAPLLRASQDKKRIPISVQPSRMPCAQKIPAERMPGTAIGRMMWTIALKREAPSMRAHSSSSFGMVLK